MDSGSNMVAAFRARVEETAISEADEQEEVSELSEGEEKEDDEIGDDCYSRK